MALEQKVHRVQSESKVNGKTSSAAPEMMQALKGATFDVTLSPERKVVRFDGLDALSNRMAARSRARFTALCTPDYFTRPLLETVTFLPGRVVRTGDRWQGKLQAGFGLFGGGTVEMLKTYCYEGKEHLEGRSLEKISFSGEGTVSLM